MRTILILNPTAGESMLATHAGSPEETEQTILAALYDRGIKPEVWYTTPEEGGRGLAQKAVAGGAELVIAAGGDGTIHEVAQGLMHTHACLGILPIGTMNNIAHSLEIPADIEQACEIIANGTTCLIDAGKVNDTVFLEVTGLGLEAALFPFAEEVKRYGFISTLRGVVSGLITLLTFRPTRFRVSFDGKRSRSFRAVQVSVCNSPFYGAHLPFAPHAVMDDGLLDVLIYSNFSKLEYIFHAVSISQGRRTLEPKVRRRQVKTLRISANPPVEIHADGVSIGQTPATIKVLPGVLRVQVPRKVVVSSNISQTTNKPTEQRTRARSHTSS